MEQRVTWEQSTQDSFLKILEQIPYMLRGIAEIRVTKKAEGLVREQNRAVITEKEMVDAFFAETPPPFVGEMKKGMQELGIDYVKYGYE